MLNNKLSHILFYNETKNKCVDVATSQHQFGTAAMGKISLSKNHTEVFRRKNGNNRQVKIFIKSEKLKKNAAPLLTNHRRALDAARSSAQSDLTPNTDARSERSTLKEAHRRFKHSF